MLSEQVRLISEQVTEGHVAECTHSESPLDSVQDAIAGLVWALICGCVGAFAGVLIALLAACLR